MNRACRKYRVDVLRPYLLGPIAEAIAAQRRSGRDIIDLSQANPDLNPPPEGIDVLIQASLRPHNHRYSSSSGITMLREAICKWYQKKRSVVLDPQNQVAATMGTKEGVAHLLLGILFPGETVLMPSPTYPIHQAAVYLAGGSSIGVPILPSLECESKDGVLTAKCDQFFTNLDRAYKRTYPHPRLLIISFPHNPTSCVVDLTFFDRLIDFARKREINVIHDYAYAEIGFDGYEPPSILQIPGAEEIAIEQFSMSKNYGVAGWRMGFVVGNAELVAVLKKVKAYVDFGLFQPLQIAAAKVLEDGNYSKKLAQIYQQRRDVFVHGLRTLGWKCLKPHASVFVWAQLPEKLSELGSMEVCRILLGKSRVGTCPGLGFGEGAEKFVRFSLVEPCERLEEAINRIKGLEENLEKCVGVP